VKENMKEKIRTFIVDNFLFGQDDGLNDDSSFLDEGIIDSTGILELVNYLEEEFSVTVDDEELIPENLDSISNVVGYLEKKMN
jgi:acyl carrier protein